MTKTIEEQIAEAREEHREIECFMAENGTQARLLARAASRLATLEAVRDGRMVEVYATVCVSYDACWRAWGSPDFAPECDTSKNRALHDEGDATTILRGYAHVPSTQVHEVEADSEVPS